MRSFLWLGSKFSPAMYQGVLMPSAASKIFSVAIFNLVIQLAQKATTLDLARNTSTSVSLSSLAFCRIRVRLAYGLPLNREARGRNMASDFPLTHSDLNRGTICMAVDFARL
jgi:hypothetical protein